MPMDELALWLAKLQRHPHRDDYWGFASLQALISSAMGASANPAEFYHWQTEQQQEAIKLARAKHGQAKLDSLARAGIIRKRTKNMEERGKDTKNPDSRNEG